MYPTLSELEAYLMERQPSQHKILKEENLLKKYLQKVDQEIMEAMNGRMTESLTEFPIQGKNNRMDQQEILSRHRQIMEILMSELFQ